MRRHVYAAVCVVLLMLGSGKLARSAEPTPEAMKARFLVQLLKYVSWPVAAEAAATSPYVVAVFGDPGFGDLLAEVVDGKKIRGRDVEVVRLADAGKASGAHVLFLADGDRADLRKIARTYHGQHVLTVADRFEFTELGGDVGIELVSGRVSFSISRRKSTRGDLGISAKLLRVASEVR